MASGDEPALRALRLLLRSSHGAGADDLPRLVAEVAAQLDAESGVLYLADYDQADLVPLLTWMDDSEDPPAAGRRVSIDGTVAGLAFRNLLQHTQSEGPLLRLWTPVVDGAERIGVLQLDFAGRRDLDHRLLDTCRDLAALLAELVMTRTLYGDAIERARRRAGMTLPAELQWRLLPPLTFVSSRVAVAGVLAPTAEVAGDCFDYALNGRRLHVAIMDAMGHGLEATLAAAVAIAALRNARRAGQDLTATVGFMDDAIASQFAGERFVTGIVAQLDTLTGVWEWIACGHPPALVVRGGRVVKVLNSVVDLPLGLALLDRRPALGRERLQPGDRLLLYTDGVVEARNPAGQEFGVDRLVEFAARQAASERPTAETLRRLNAAILAHQLGHLQDDATTVLIEWQADARRRNLPTPGTPPDP